MAVARFCYDPFKGDFLLCTSSHALGLKNRGKSKAFDDYIRGIIVDDRLYLRLYWPYGDVSSFTLADLRQKSEKLLRLHIDAILAEIETHYNIVPANIVYNADNDLLSGVGLANV